MFFMYVLTADTIYLLADLVFGNFVYRLKLQVHCEVRVLAGY